MTDGVRVVETDLARPMVGGVRPASEAENDEHSRLAELVTWSAAIAGAETLPKLAQTAVDALVAVFAAEARVVLRHDGIVVVAGPNAPLSRRGEVPDLVVPEGADRVGGTLEIERPSRPLDRVERLLAVHLRLVTFSCAERLVSLAAAREKARERQDIVMIVAHDLRTPLQTFAMGLDAIESACDEPTRTGVAPSTQRMKRAIADMTRLLEDLLDVSRIHDGLLPVRLEPHVVGPMIEDLRAQHEPAARKKGVALLTRVSPRLALTCDPQRLRQALGNVLANAVRHVERGSITLTARPVDEGRVRFEIEDTGPGVPPAVRARLFERLFQGETAGRGGGIGLGLYIVRGIVEAHGGTFGLDSEVNRGSSFWMELPRATPT